MTPGEQARAAVREQMHDVRVACGETSPEAEQYIARHAEKETQP